MQTAALFDFDNTLTSRDTLWPFMKFTHGSLAAYTQALSEIPSLVSYLFGATTRQDLKEKFLTRFYSGIPIDILRQKGCEFARSHLTQYLRKEAMARLQWHQRQGHRCILVSAAIEVYLEPWARDVGFHEVITSKLDIDSADAVTGLLKGPNCWGPEKTRRLSDLIPDRNQYCLYAYGDSRGDKELLALADYPFYRKFS